MKNLSASVSLVVDTGKIDAPSGRGPSGLPIEKRGRLGKKLKIIIGFGGGQGMIMH